MKSLLAFGISLEAALVSVVNLAAAAALFSVLPEATVIDSTTITTI